MSEATILNKYGICSVSAAYPGEKWILHFKPGLCDMAFDGRPNWFDTTLSKHLAAELEVDPSYFHIRQLFRIQMVDDNKLKEFSIATYANTNNKMRHAAGNVREFYLGFARDKDVSKIIPEVEIHFKSNALKMSSITINKVNITVLDLAEELIDLATMNYTDIDKPDRGWSETHLIIR